MDCLTCTVWTTSWSHCLLSTVGVLWWRQQRPVPGGAWAGNTTSTDGEASATAQRSRNHRAARLARRNAGLMDWFGITLVKRLTVSSTAIMRVCGVVYIQLTVQRRNCWEQRQCGCRQCKRYFSVVLYVSLLWCTVWDVFSVIHCRMFGPLCIKSADIVDSSGQSRNSLTDNTQSTVFSAVIIIYFTCFHRVC